MTENTVTHSPDHDGDEGYAERRRAADIALGSVRAEGGEPSQEVRDLVERSVAGELTPEEVSQLVVQRYDRR